MNLIASLTFCFECLSSISTNKIGLFLFIVSMDFFLQNKVFVQPRSSVMPAAVAHQVVDSWKA